MNDPLGPDGRRAWEELAQHIEWSDGPWLVFLFTKSAALAQVLRQQLMTKVDPLGGVRVIRPRTPQQLRELLPLVLTPAKQPYTWLEAVHLDAGDGDGPWREAWDWFMLRANERRERLMRSVGGGMIICAPTSLKVRFREAAPDIWSIRSLILEPETPPITREERPEQDDPTLEVDALVAQGWITEAAPLAQATLDLARKHAEVTPRNRRRQSRLALACEQRGAILREQGDIEGAFKVLAEALGLRTALAEGPNSRRRNQRADLARTQMLLGRLQADRGDPAALTLLAESVTGRIALAREAGDDPESLADLALSHSLYGDVLLGAGDEDGARRAYADSLEIRRHVVRVADAPRHRRWLSVAWGRMGRALLRIGDRVGARSAWQRAVQLAREVAASDPGNVAWAMEASVAECRWGDAAFADGELDQAEQAWTAALKTRRLLTAQDPDNAHWQEYLAVALGRMARLHAARGQHTRAEDAARQALAVSTALVDEHPGNTHWSRGRDRARQRLQEITQQHGSDFDRGR